MGGANRSHKEVAEGAENSPSDPIPEPNLLEPEVGDHEGLGEVGAQYE